MSIELGKTVTCNITGFTGTAISRCENIDMPIEILVLPKVGEDGKYPESRWVLESRLGAGKTVAVTEENLEEEPVETAAEKKKRIAKEKRDAKKAEAEKEAAEEEAAEEEAAEEASEDAVTMDDLREVAKQLVEAGKTPEVRKVCVDVGGVKKVSALDPSDFAEALEALKAKLEDEDVI